MAGESTATPFGDGAYIPDPLAQFLGRVLPSVAGPSDGFVNIHAFGGVRTPYHGGGQAFAGMAEYGALQSFVSWLNHNESDVFFCLSTQTHDGTTDVRGKRKVGKGGRGRKSARWIKSFVLDLDVKPTGYSSQRAALAALLPFCEQNELEPLLTSSGRGVHAYVTLSESITPAVWQPMADRLIAAAQAADLKFDVGVTRNAATLLRLPTTFNRKDRSQPLECRVLSWGGTITAAELGALLAPYPAKSAPHLEQSRPTLDPAIFPPRRPINGPEAEHVRADLEHSRVVTSIELLRGACPVVADSERRGGDTDIEPLWFELAKLCHYVENGRDYFHDLSSEDARYDEQATDAKYDTAQPQGWPACATIAAASSAAARICEGCSHFGKGRSPIHFARGGQTNGMVNGHAHPLAAASDIFVPLQLPNEYEQLPDGRIITRNERKFVYATPIYNIDLLSDADGIGGYNEFALVTIPSGLPSGELSTFKVSCSTLTSSQKIGELADHGMVCPDPAIARKFGVSVIDFIRTNRAAYKTARHGWVTSDGKITGFSFGNTLFTADGPKPSPAKSHHWYTPTGNLAAWKRAANIFIGKGLIDHEILIATGFAAPLMQFTLVDGATVLARSGTTGIGKTASLETANSVWAHRHAVMRAGTINATVSRLATLHNLPGCFDDMPIRNGKFSQLITPVTSGKDKDRLNRAGDEVEPRTLRTLLVVTSNETLAQTTDNPDTNALAARVFEFHMTDSVSTSGVPDSERLDARNSMEMNHGVAGMVLGEFLGRHHEAAKAMVSDTVAGFKSALQLGDEARFWTAAASTIFVGATIAKKLDLIAFDTTAMYRRLCEHLRQQRSLMKDMQHNSDDPDVQADRLAEFLNENLHAIIRTDMKPSPGNKVAMVENTYELTNTREYVARIARLDKWMLVSAAKVAKWCRLRGFNPTEMKTALIKAGRCNQSSNRRSLTAQTKITKRAAEEYLLEFDLAHPANQRFLPQ